MCGIVGIIAKEESAIKHFDSLGLAVDTLKERGPNHQGDFKDERCGLGHARLSIIDITEGASQPFYSSDKRYVLVFNGEIYNYKELKKQLITKGYSFITSSDTEVLLYWLIENGSEGINKLHGFFAFCLYDSQNQTYLFGRDRYGIKPLLIYQDEEKIVFGSELKALYPLGIKKEIDPDSLKMYFKFNYIPLPYSIYKGISKLSPGRFIKVDSSFNFTTGTYYNIEEKDFGKSTLSYEKAKKELRKLIDQSIEERMIADVPLGTFLSGGIDSSIITGIASQKTKNLNSFSIGYADEPLFDETSYANLVAKKFKTNHTVFKLKNNDLFEQLDKVLDYTDEPMADSSGLAVNILCQNTKNNVTVALSGDGADEIFSGYNKHTALLLASQKSLKNSIIKSGAPFYGLLPQSRNSKMGNVVRQLQKFSNGMRLSEKERYWLWAGFLNEFELNKLLKVKSENYVERKESILSTIKKDGDFNNVLHTDVNLVLAGDMLQKVDMNSMSNSLEVRVPFLDHRVVDFAFSLPVDYKIQKGMKKRILQDAYRDFLPNELYNRPKHGFEVPLLNWFKTDLKSRIFDEYLAADFIEEQGIFQQDYITELKSKLFSNSPGDSTATIWALIVFQHWYKKYHLA